MVWTKNSDSAMKYSTDPYRHMHLSVFENDNLLDNQLNASNWKYPMLNEKCGGNPVLSTKKCVVLINLPFSTSVLKSAIINEHP